MSSTGDSGRPNQAPVQRAAWIDGGDSIGSAAEARIGETRLVRGGATVSTFTEDSSSGEVPAPAQGRIVTEAEIAESGLLRERVIEIGEMREVAVVSKQTVVREELVVRKDIEERTERVAETLRRTEVDIERLETVESGRDSPGR